MEAHTSWKRWKAKETVKLWVNLTDMVMFLIYLNKYQFLMWTWKSSIMDYIKYLEVECMKTKIERMQSIIWDYVLSSLSYSMGICIIFNLK